MIKWVILAILLLVGCSTEPTLQDCFNYDRVVGTEWYIDEEINILQTCRLFFQFNSDTIYLKRVYFETKTGEVDYTIYMKGPVFNFKCLEDHTGMNVLEYTWKRKHYADASYSVQVEDNSIVDEWFIQGIDSTGSLQMGQVQPPNVCYYWTFTRAQ